MACSACGTDSRIVFSVPAEYREYAPADASTAAICPRCLTVEPVADGEDESKPAFDRISDAFPSRPERAVPLALALGLCSSLATNRAAIESLFEAVERAGADPLLVIDRLRAEPTVDPAVDLERRRHQLEQLLY